MDVGIVSVAAADGLAAAAVVVVAGPVVVAVAVDASPLAQLVQQIASTNAYRALLRVEERFGSPQRKGDHTPTT